MRGIGNPCRIWNPCAKDTRSVAVALGVPHTREDISHGAIQSAADLSDTLLGDDTLVLAEIVLNEILVSLVEIEILETHIAVTPRVTPRVTPPAVAMAMAPVHREMAMCSGVTGMRLKHEDLIDGVIGATTAHAGTTRSDTGKSVTKGIADRDWSEWREEPAIQRTEVPHLGWGFFGFFFRVSFWGVSFWISPHTKVTSAPPLSKGTPPRGLFVF